MISLETVTRIVYSIDAMAKAKGITARHELDTLVGIATRALAEGKKEPIAFEIAREHADRMLNASECINQMLSQVSIHQHHFAKQALHP